MRMAKEVEESDFKWLMGTRRGRRIVRGALDRAAVFDSSFQTNSMAMAQTEGAKREGYHLIGMVNRLCPELYHVMLQEAFDDRPNDDAGRNNH